MTTLACLQAYVPILSLQFVTQMRFEYFIHIYIDITALSLHSHTLTPIYICSVSIHIGIFAPNSPITAPNENNNNVATMKIPPTHLCVIYIAFSCIHMYLTVSAFMLPHLRVRHLTRVYLPKIIDFLVQTNTCTDI